MIEEWKDLVGWEGLYQVSSLGQIKSLAHRIIRSNGWTQTFRERILTQTPEKDGYLQVTLCLNSEYTTYKVHRLVAQHFIGNPFDKPDVNHKDLNKANNEAGNLEWTTKKQNILHALTMGVRFGKSMPGKSNPNYKHGRYVKKQEKHGHSL